MTTYYKMIIEPAEITIDSHFYRVAVGRTQAYKKALRWLNNYALRVGAYLHIVDAESDKFWLNIAKSLGVNVWDIPSLEISAVELMKQLRDNQMPPAMPEMSKQVSVFKMLTSPVAYFKRQTSVLHHAEAIQRNKPKAVSAGTHSLQSPQNDRPRVDGHQI